MISRFEKYNYVGIQHGIIILEALARMETRGVPGASVELVSSADPTPSELISSADPYPLLTLWQVQGGHQLEGGKSAQAPDGPQRSAAMGSQEVAEEKVPLSTSLCGRQQWATQMRFLSRACVCLCVGVHARMCSKICDECRDSIQLGIRGFPSDRRCLRVHQPRLVSW